MVYRKLVMAAAILAGIVAMPTIAAAQQAVVTGNVNVRTGPGTGYARVATLPAGSMVRIRTCQGSWCSVAGAGIRGWMSANYLDRVTTRRPVIVTPPPIVVRPSHYHHRPPHYRPPHHRPRPRPNCRIAPGFPCR